jgi:ABC-2 type transport system ATP-binding protein
MSVIVVEGLERRFGDLVAVDDVSFEIEAGEVVALLGPNGAGKTTTLEMLEGYLAPTGGRMSVLGADPRRAGRAWRARIGVVLQSTSLDPQLTVRDALTVFSRVFPRPRSVTEVLELIGLESEVGTAIGQLSGGQQRRVDLGLGIVGRPEVLFLDEPTTGLDPAARRGSWRILEHLADEGATVLLSTHYMEEAQHLADRLLILAEGRLVVDSPSETLRASMARSTIRLPLPAGVGLSEPPGMLAGHLADGQLELVVDSADLSLVVGQLLEWAQANDLDLAGIEIAPPSLEDTYLELTAPTNGRGIPSHA